MIDALHDAYEPEGLKAGVWSGTLHQPEAPKRVLLALSGTAVATGRAEAGQSEDSWHISVDIPPTVIAEGMHSLLLLIDDGNDGDPIQPGAIRLARLTLMAGEPIDHDLRAEIELMRAELELLKAEFRRLATL